MNEELRKLQEEIKDLKRQQQWIDNRLKGVNLRLDRYMADLSSKEELPDKKVKPAADKAVMNSREAAPAAPSVEQVKAEKTVGELENKLGGIWLNRIGIFVFILGAAFFLKYAFDHGWINEVTRIIAGAATGLILIVLGERSRRKGYKVFAQGITGGGIALLYFTVFAAFYYYNLISPTAGVGLMILVTSGAVALSVYQDAPAVAVLGLLTGFLNPILFVAEETQLFQLLIYLALLNLGVLAVTYFKCWPFMGISGFILTAIYMLAILIYRLYSDPSALSASTYQIFLSIFFILHLGLPFLMYALHGRPLRAPGILLIAATAILFYSYGWYNLKSIIPDDIGLFVLALSAFFFLLGLGLQRLPFKDNWAGFSAFALGTAAMVRFIPVQFSQPWVTVTWTLLAVALCYLALALPERRLHAGFWFLSVITFIYLIAVEWTQSIPAADYVFLWNSPFLLTLLFITGLAACSWLQHRYAPHPEKGTTVWVLGFTAGLILLIFGSMEISRYGSALAELTQNYYYYRNLSMIFISSFWTAYAVVLALTGFIARIPPLRFAAIALFGMTVCKVFLLDLSSLELVFRIISLVGLGLFMLAVSFLYQRYRDRVA